LTLDPQLRKKLLNESRNPFFGVRRLLWIVLFGSATLGFLIMATRALSGEVVLWSDVGIQLTALLLFGGLTFFDRRRRD
tara:strand:+ start:136 stop:372 length:237 start_codon:yes stop_codon:yes gene_type:complete